MIDARAVRNFYLLCCLGALAACSNGRGSVDSEEPPTGGERPDHAGLDRPLLVSSREPSAHQRADRSPGGLVRHAAHRQLELADRNGANGSSEEARLQLLRPVHLRGTSARRSGDG